MSLINKSIRFVYFFAILNFSVMIAGENKIGKRNTFLTVIELLSKSTSSLKTAYANSKLKDVGDVALTFVDSIPIIGDIVYLFSQPPGDDEMGLKTVTENLQVLSKNIETVGIKIDQLSKEIDISVIKNAVAGAIREIKNCYKDFMLFLQSPSSNAEQDRLKSCYSKFAYVREIGYVIKPLQLSFQQKPLFEQLIEARGYCDGEEINDVFRFLLGIYIEGCSALVTSEVLTYGNQSTTFRDECKATIRSGEERLQDIYKNCILEPCNNIFKPMTDILKLNDDSEIHTQMLNTFPWFRYVIIKLKNGVNADLSFYHAKINYISFSDSGSVYRLLMWSPNDNNRTSGLYKYGIEFRQNSIESKFNGMNLNEATFNGRTSLFGYYDETNSNAALVCQHNVNTNTDAGNIVTNNYNFSLPGWAIGILIVLIIFLIVVCICVCCCCCRTK